jgi:hypothetical protein
MPMGDTHHMVRKDQDYVVGEPGGMKDLPGSQNSHRRGFSESMDIPVRNLRDNYVRKGSKDSSTGFLDAQTQSLGGPTPRPLPK